jgi:hypothetical protein
MFFLFSVLTLFSWESTPEAVDLNEGTYTEVLRDTIIDDKNNYWDSELKLPKGVVIAKDCTNCTSEVNQKISDNYVTIKKTNGVLTIIRDIDVDTYLNLKINDIIK